ncbi:eight-cysteine-cluster domain-containing protein [Candidatus Shapirobacteria bacterium]|nr:eight-cysteine-cluster domain-containing protein [Candidatus Shapirobacteria bacterium]
MEKLKDKPVGPDTNKVRVAGLAVTVLFTGIVFALTLYFRRTSTEVKNQQTTPSSSPIPTETFCGSSSLGKCAVDKDCLAGGCSGQICGTKNEGGRFTTCEWRDCYEARKYGLECKCIDKKCQWSKND